MLVLFIETCCLYLGRYLNCFSRKCPIFSDYLQSISLLIFLFYPQGNERIRPPWNPRLAACVSPRNASPQCMSTETLRTDS
ncbi:hypothetical protein GDO78_018135 [Eleutherodactylus coqui]|uniref:Uncharacterized protein n=1 Tax=Eleutherodactylus coqui TaxID=57060 RepID=A0A8J6AZM5_ELECQ|nr:hypothetical protein GDO78_018135 [Eleutherodactylus coqui]